MCRAYSTRAAASAWWVFALVVTSSYTANLATLLARKSSDELISGVTDLAHNPYGIEYGAKAGGATYTFFEVCYLYTIVVCFLVQQQHAGSAQCPTHIILTTTFSEDSYSLFPCICFRLAIC